jgi:hypothetical protein
MECQICYKLLETTTNLCITECRHQFCSQCIFTWIRKSQSCPVCRKDLLSQNNVCVEISATQSFLSTVTQYKNNFIQFLKEHVISQNFMNIRLLYTKLLQDYIYFQKRTSSCWRHNIENTLRRNKNIISHMSLDNLQYASKTELEYDNHPSAVLERIYSLDDCETEIFHEIFLECLYLYNLKNNNDKLNFSSLISLHDEIIF